MLGPHEAGPDAGIAGIRRRYVAHEEKAACPRGAFQPRLWARRKQERCRSALLMSGVHKIMRIEA